ncbi:hypothetical protein BN176_1270048 [Clostridioides difficile E19]|nr:hypothetical protein BN176_1270048 [Clostridioides difficile E19]
MQIYSFQDAYSFNIENIINPISTKMNDFSMKLLNGPPTVKKPKETFFSLSG